MHWDFSMGFSGLNAGFFEYIWTWTKSSFTTGFLSMFWTWFNHVITFLSASMCLSPNMSQKDVWNCKHTIKVCNLWFAILDAQIETGSPFMFYRLWKLWVISIVMGLNLNTYSPLVKLNQKNIGTIRLSNLGTEIVKYSAPDEVAICNLASIALHTFISADNKVWLW